MTVFCHDVKIELITERCSDCGRYWACESGAAYSVCPHCKSKYFAGIEDENRKLKRSNAALRGHRGR